MSGLPTIIHSESDGRWDLIRDALVFQLKLALDGLRDLVFSPLSLAAALFDLLTGGRHPGRFFHGLLLSGRRTEAWINLFGVPRWDEPRETDGVEGPHEPTVDALVKQVEGLLVEQFEQGGLTAAAKQAIDRSLEGIVRRRRARRDKLEP